MSRRIYKRGNVWWARVAGPDGRIVRVSTHCRDEKAAALKWRELERKHANPAHYAENSVTLLDAFESLREARVAAGRADGTLQMIDVKARHWMRVFGRDCLLSKIDAKAVDRFVSIRVQEGASRSTVHKELVVLRGALRLAKRRGDFGRPLEDVMPIAFAIRYRPRERWLTEDECRAVLRALPARRAAAVAFMLATAARSSEMATARRSDVDGTRVLLRGEKTEGARREVPVVPFARAWLAFALENAAGDDPLFEPWTNMRRDLRDVAEKLGIQPFSPNDLRRTLATMLRSRGVEPSLIGAVLGHRDGRMVERVYGRIPTDQLEELLGARLRTRRAQRLAK